MFPEEVYRQDLIRWHKFPPDFFSFFLLFADHGGGLADHFAEIGEIGAKHDL